MGYGARARTKVSNHSLHKLCSGSYRSPLKDNPQFSKPAISNTPNEKPKPQVLSAVCDVLRVSWGLCRASGRRLLRQLGARLVFLRTILRTHSTRENLLEALNPTLHSRPLCVGYQHNHQDKSGSLRHVASSAMGDLVSWGARSFAAQGLKLEILKHCLAGRAMQEAKKTLNLEPKCMYHCTLSPVIEAHPFCRLRVRRSAAMPTRRFSQEADGPVVLRRI